MCVVVITISLFLPLGLRVLLRTRGKELTGDTSEAPMAPTKGSLEGNSRCARFARLRKYSTPREIRRAACRSLATTVVTELENVGE